MNVVQNGIGVIHVSDHFTGEEFLSLRSCQLNQLHHVCRCLGFITTRYEELHSDSLKIDGLQINFDID